MGGGCAESGTEWWITNKNAAVMAVTLAMITTFLVEFMQPRLFFDTCCAARGRGARSLQRFEPSSSLSCATSSLGGM